MICTELERCGFEYLANVLVGGVEPIKVPYDNPIVVPIGEQSLRLYRGESNTDLVHPSIVVACEGGDEDFDTGNQMCNLEVLATFSVDPATENPTPLDALDTLAEQIVDHMMVSDLHDRLNVYAGPRFTAIDITGRSHRKQPGDRTTSHYVVVSLYCSGRNLNPPI